ncbi:MAG: hypothetical protein Q9184_007357 [Pyrenodesmia sp. 2 TL-2023]
MWSKQKPRTSPQTAQSVTFTPASTPRLKLSSQANPTEYLSLYPLTLTLDSTETNQQRGQVCNVANTASLSPTMPSTPFLHPGSKSIKVGFYTLDSSSTRDGRDAQLILGPFIGKVACQSIRFRKGVCGTAAAEKRIVRVDDMEEFPGYIACDADKSEIVVPVVARRG